MINICNEFTNTNNNMSLILEGKYLGLEEILPQKIIKKIGIENIFLPKHLGIQQRLSISKDYKKMLTSEFI